MEFSDGVRASDAWRRLIDAFAKDLVAGMRLKEAARRLGVEPGTLHNKLEGKNGSVLHARELFVLLFTATDAQRDAVLDVIDEECGNVRKKRSNMTDREELEDLREKVAKRFGEAGQELVQQRSRR